MDSLNQYLDFLYGNQQGFVYSPTLDRSSKEFEQHFFAWPTEKDKLASHIHERGGEVDVYICPSVFSKKEARKDSFKSTSVVWVEFDGKEEISFKDVPQPDAIVQTSSDTHLHCYWKINESSDYTEIERVNRKLTYHLQADSSGWDCTQLLRPPQTKNIKRGGLDVVLSHFSDRLFDAKLSPKQFDALPEIETVAIELKLGTLLDPVKLLEQLPLLKSLRHKIEKEQVGEGDRSQFLYKVAHELAEIGCNHTQISTIIYYVDERIGKFKDRADRLTRISELASIALNSVSAEDSISLYSPEDILNHTEDLNWIFEKWLHELGLMIVTGAPGVGKTQFCLQMAYAFSVGAPFLDWELPKLSTLVMSLEMDVRELKIFLRLQASDESFTQLSEWSKNCKIIDEPGTFLQYEEIIEQTRPRVVIIDSMLEWANGELKDSGEVIQLTRWLKRIRRKYHCAFVLIHHIRKATNGNKKPNRLEDIFGSIIINKDIDTAFVLWKEEDQQNIEVCVVKSRYSQREDFFIERNNHLVFSRSEAPTANSEPAGNSAAKANLGFNG